MRSTTIISVFLCSIFLINGVGLAFETDQFNLPKVPLTDIGDEVSGHIEEGLRTAVAQVNADISSSLACIESKAKICDSQVKEEAKLVRLRSGQAVAEAFFKLVGDGSLFITKFGRWMRSHEFRSQPATYKADFRESIYILNPANYLTLSPTVKLYGTEFGTDKLDHLFQQGYKYCTIRRDAVAKGVSSGEAEKKAIKWGQRSERTYFGLLVSGVYSNADLYANYAGMKFYDGLTAPIRFGENDRPPILALSDGRWRIDEEHLRENLLKPFLSEHLNEALNPSSYRATLVRSVRRAVKRYSCPEWKAAYPDLTAASITARSKSLELWNGEDYGFTKRDRVVTIAETCFGS